MRTPTEPVEVRRPIRMKDQAHLISGSFDVVVSKLGCLSTALQNKEHVREISESSTDRSSNGGGAVASDSGQFAHVTCHYCSEKGHIARFCAKKKADREANRPGNATGTRQSPPGAAPQKPQGAPNALRK